MIVHHQCLQYLSQRRGRLSLRSSVHPPKINQPPSPFATLPAYAAIRLPLQTPPRDIAVRAYVLDQALFADVVVFRTDETEDEEVQRGVVEFCRQRGRAAGGGGGGRGEWGLEDVDFDGAGLVGVEGVVADAEDGGVG